MIFLEYPKCGTCIKAKKHLNGLNIKYVDRDIILDNPQADELRKWIKDSGADIKKFFNTSGVMYREMQLSKKMDNMSFEEMIKVLASNGKLVKRPLIIKDNKEVIIGYKKEEYDKLK